MYADREQRLTHMRDYNRKRREARRIAWFRPMKHKLASQRDLAAYLKSRGNLHMHWVRHSDCYSWILIYQRRSPVCDTDRCVMIPLTVT